MLLVNSVKVFLPGEIGEGMYYPWTYGRGISSRVAGLGGPDQRCLHTAYFGRGDFVGLELPLSWLFRGV